MFKLKLFSPLLLSAIFIAAVCGGCSKNVPSTTSTTAAAAPQAPDAGIEVEIVQPTAIEGSINATGKVLAMEDRTASIGPVHEGRIVNLYAGQGTIVRK